MDLHTQAVQFLEMVHNEIELSGVQLGRHWIIDHLCFRTDSIENYKKAQGELSEFGELLIESQVNGRMISTYELHQPISFGQQMIRLIEVPAPKVGKISQQGFEHIEYVVDLPLAELCEQYPHLDWDKSGFKKVLNQELELKFQSMAVKFHNMSLQSVIHFEKNDKVFHAVQEAKILELLRPYKPLIAGTYPLSLQTDESDVDILLQCHDLKTLGFLLQNTFSKLSKFELKETFIESKPALVIHFEYETVKFEILAFDCSTVRQMAYRHFLIEERLLQLGGRSVLQQIQGLRKQGFKTEAAFTKWLGLEGDPFNAMLRLEQLSLSQLRAVMDKRC